MATQNPKPAPPREVWLDQVHADEKTTAMRFMIAFGIRKFANSKTLECWPSQARLASEARVTVRTVQAELTALCKCGHLEKICPPNRRLGNRYRLRVKGMEIANSGSHENERSMRTGLRMEKQASSETSLSWPCEPGFARNFFKEPLNPTPTPTPPPPTSSESEIEDFLEAYPFNQTMSVEAAETAFAALSIKDRLKAIRFARVYGDAIKAQNRNHPMHAVNWLKRRKFDDAERVVNAKAAAPSVSGSGIFVARGTDAWEAWSATRSKPWPFTNHGGSTGWFFPSLFPPAPCVSAIPVGNASGSREAFDRVQAESGAAP
jgi:hypothetical protein